MRQAPGPKEYTMIRERAQKAVLIIVGLLFVATIYPLLFLLRNDETLQMMFSFYVTLGVFLLLASRNPSAHRSLIAFAAWSSLAHASVMAVQAIGDVTERVHLLIGVAMFAVIGLLLVALAPAKATTTATVIAAWVKR
jgi:hypothetical protein